MATEKNNRNAQFDVLEVLYKHPFGYVAELENMIGEEDVRELEAIGYIENAPSEKGNTYKISNMVKHMTSAFFDKRTFRDFISDFYFTYIKRVSFSL